MVFKQVGPTSPADLNHQHRLIHDGDYLEEHIRRLSTSPDITAKQKELLGYARAELLNGNRQSALKYFNQAQNTHDASIFNKVCPMCKGEGEVNGKKCPECDGVGMVHDKKGTSDVDWRTELKRDIKTAIGPGSGATFSDIKSMLSAKWDLQTSQISDVLAEMVRGGEITKSGSKYEWA